MVKGITAFDISHHLLQRSRCEVSVDACQRSCSKRNYDRRMPQATDSWSGAFRAAQVGKIKSMMKTIAGTRMIMFICVGSFKHSRSKSMKTRKGQGHKKKANTNTKRVTREQALLLGCGRGGIAMAEERPDTATSSDAQAEELMSSLPLALYCCHRTHVR